MTYMPIDALSRRISGMTAAHRIVQSLIAAYPNGISAKNLMIRAGLGYHNDPFSAFVKLCCARAFVQPKLERVGWTIDRTGGTPDHGYRLCQLPAGGTR